MPLFPEKVQHRERKQRTKCWKGTRIPRASGGNVSSSCGMQKSWDGLGTPIQAVNLPLLLQPFAFSGLFPPPCGIAAGDGDQSTAGNKNSQDLHGSRTEMLDKEVSVSQLQQNKHHGAKGIPSGCRSWKEGVAVQRLSLAVWAGTGAAAQGTNPIPQVIWRSAGWKPWTPSDVSDPLLNNSSTP